MATTLLGTHYDLTCPTCNLPFSCDAEADDGDQPAICPNCGAKLANSSSLHPLAGDRVLIDRTAFLMRRPRRWEVVAFQRRLAGQDLFVKRVVGLPGEKITIQDGDIYVNGTIQRKTLRQQRAMRILVHDDDYAGPAPRWQPEEIGSNWNRQSGPVRRVHAENTDDDIGWLVYNQASPANDQVQASARVTDYSFYNRGRLQGNDSIHFMADVAMSFRIVDIHGRGLFALKATDGREDFFVQIDPGAGKYVVNRCVVPSKPGDYSRWNPCEWGWSGELSGSLRGQTIEVSLFDRQFLFSIAGRPLVTIDMDTSRPPPLAEKPLAIGVGGLGLVVDHLRVYRDVYYTQPPFAAAGAPGTPGRGASPYAPGVEYVVQGDNSPWNPCAWRRRSVEEYFVLGDNSPVSEDSRTWTGDPFVRDTDLVGKPFLVIFPSCEFSLGTWRIQVPDFGRMRYIR